MLECIKKGLFVCVILLCTAFAVKNQTIEALLHTPLDPVLGNANSNITVVEFFDYQCPHCIKVAPIVDDIIKHNPQVRFVFKELSMRGSMSRLAASAGIAANKQGKYYSFHYALLMRKKPLSKQFILATAKEYGINTDQLEKDMNDASVIQQLNDNLQLAKALKVPGTPAFFISKTNPQSTDKVIYVLGEMTAKQLQHNIDKLEAAPKRLKTIDKLGMN